MEFLLSFDPAQLYSVLAIRQYHGVCQAAQSVADEHRYTAEKMKKSSCAMKPRMFITVNDWMVCNAGDSGFGTSGYELLCICTRSGNFGRAHQDTAECHRWQGPHQPSPLPPQSMFLRGTQKTRTMFSNVQTALDLIVDICGD